MRKYFKYKKTNKQIFLLTKKKKIFYSFLLLFKHTFNPPHWQWLSSISSKLIFSKSEWYRCILLNRIGIAIAWISHLREYKWISRCLSIRDNWSKSIRITHISRNNRFTLGNNESNWSNFSIHSGSWRINETSSRLRVKCWTGLLGAFAYIETSI